MLTGALSALVIVGVLAVVMSHSALGAGATGRADACRDVTCQLNRCAQAHSDQPDRGPQAPCPYSSTAASTETVRTSRRRVTWRIVPGVGP